MVAATQVALLFSSAGLNVKIPDDSIIPLEKLTRYLLVVKVRNDKSKYLAQAGFTQENPEELLEAIRSLTGAVEAEQEKTTDYGTFYVVKGELVGVNGVRISVITIWPDRKADGKFQFITLIPD
jgi:biopolymer transport protein ExbD